MLKKVNVCGLSTLLVLFSLSAFSCHGESSIIACKCSESSGYYLVEQSKRLSTFRVCIQHTNDEAILLGLHDMAIATKNDTVFTSLDEEPSFTVECSQNFCAMGITVGDEYYYSGLMDALDSSSMELSGNVTVQELIDGSTGRFTSKEISFLVYLSRDDDSCPVVAPETATLSVKGAAMVMIALVLVVIMCCYGAKFRKTTASDIPL